MLIESCTESSGPMGDMNISVDLTSQKIETSINSTSGYSFG